MTTPDPTLEVLDDCERMLDSQDGLRALGALKPFERHRLYNILAFARRALQAPATREDSVDAEGYRHVWDWDSRARFLHARAEEIHRMTADGVSTESIRISLSMDEMQVRLIAATSLEDIPGLPGAVWPPKRFQTPTPPLQPHATEQAGEVDWQAEAGMLLNDVSFISEAPAQQDLVARELEAAYRLGAGATATREAASFQRGFDAGRASREK